MSIQLKKGESFLLTKAGGTSLSDVYTFGLGFTGKKGRSIDLDSYIGVLDSAGNPLNFIYFGKRTAMGIFHNGDDMDGGGDVTKPNETIEITLSKLEPRASKLIIGLFVYSSGETLKNVSSSFANVETSSGKELCRYNLANDFQKYKSVEVATIEKNSKGSWEVEAVGQGSSHGFNKIKKKFTYGESPSRGSSQSTNWIGKLLDFILELFD
jgi:tellurium resistance protein TerZ